MRILVAEDDTKLRAHLVAALSSAGYSVDDTGDGEEALWLAGELLARLRAVLRRRRPDMSSLVRIADLEIDLHARLVKRAGQEIALTNREFALLETLAEASPRHVTKTTLVERAWDRYFDSGTNVLNVYISYLRKKIDLLDLPPLLHTVRGIGFALREEPA